MSKLRLKNVLFNVLAIVTLLVAGFVIFNIASGMKGYAVTSDSMTDTLKTGDIVFSKKVSFDELKIGDIVTVGSDETKEYFTHRIVGIDKKKKTITTRGDNNPENDPMDTSSERIVGKMRYSVPLLGFITIAFGKISQPVGLIIFAGIAIVLIGINIILTSIKKKNGGGSDEQN